MSVASVAKTKPVKPSKAELLDYYREMLLIRRFEEKAPASCTGWGFIGGFCHLYIGQEAVVVGMQAAIKQGRSGDHCVIATMATCWPCGMDRERRSWPNSRGACRWLVEVARAARCTCSRD
jgi:hypothetical protein